MAQSELAKPSDTGLWRLWRVYLVRWLIFGIIAGFVGQPVTSDFDHFWLQKVTQGFSGLFFGFICWLVFTPLQNKVNPSRKKWVSWLTVIGTWMGVKFALTGIMLALGL